MIYFSIFSKFMYTAAQIKFQRKMIKQMINPKHIVVKILKRCCLMQWRNCRSYWGLIHESWCLCKMFKSINPQRIIRRVNDESGSSENLQRGLLTFLFKKFFSDSQLISLNISHSARDWHLYILSPSSGLLGMNGFRPDLLGRGVEPISIEA